MHGVSCNTRYKIVARTNSRNVVYRWSCERGKKTMKAHRNQESFQAVGSSAMARSQAASQVGETHVSQALS